MLKFQDVNGVNNVRKGIRVWQLELKDREKMFADGKGDMEEKDSTEEVIFELSRMVKFDIL